MTTAHPERNWTQLQEGLNRVRKELGVNPHASLDPEDKPARNMSAGKKRHVYPSRRTPPQLPRLSTPPEYYSDDDLRRGRRKVVPPVKPKRDAFQRPVSDEDSYDSGESSDEDPRAYPYPNGPAPGPQPYPYGYYQPPMVYPAMPAFYPQPQPQRTKRRDKAKGKGKGSRYRPQDKRDTRVKHLGSRPSKRVPETHTSYHDAATHTVQERGTQADDLDTVQDARALSKFKAKESLNYTPVVNDLLERRTGYPTVGGQRMDPTEIGYLRPKQAVYDTANIYPYSRRSPQPGTSLYPYTSALDTYKYIHPDQQRPSYSPVMKRPPADRSQAATAIQKTFRGYNTRKGDSSSSSSDNHTSNLTRRDKVTGLDKHVLPGKNRTVKFLKQAAKLPPLTRQDTDSAHRQTTPTRGSAHFGGDITNSGRSQHEASALDELFANDMAEGYIDGYLSESLIPKALTDLLAPETTARLHFDRVLRSFVVIFINSFLKDEAIPDVLISVLKTDQSKAGMSAAFHFHSDRRFAENYVDSLVQEMIEEELVPDILIEVLSEHNNESVQVPTRHSLPHGLTARQEDLAAGLTEDFLHSQLQPQLREVVLESNRELVDRYFAEKLFNPGPILDVSADIMEEAVQDGVDEAVKSAISDMVGDTIYRGAAYDWMMDLSADVMGEFMPDIVREAVFDVILEQMIETEIVSEVVGEEAHNTATQVLDKYDNAVQRRELREVASRANKRLLDGVFLHHLLNLFARDGKVLSREDLALKALDGVVLDILLKEYFMVRKSRQFTLDNWSTKRLHEKVVTDTAVDVVLTELGQQLDEDMEDLHEYEWELEDPDSFRAGGLDLKEWLGKLNVSPR